MEKIFKDFSEFFLITGILLISCSDLPYSPFDRAYNGDYSFGLQINKDTLYPFTPYVFHFTSGTDSYVDFGFYTDPPGVVDPLFFQSRKSNDSLGFYFTRPFSGNILITGLRKNEYCDTFRIVLSASEPVRIEYIRVVFSPDTLKSFLLSEDRFSSEQIKNVIWFLDTIAIDTLSIKDTCAIPVYSSEDLIISASLSDWQGYWFSTPPCTVFSRQFQMKMRVAGPLHPLTIGDTVILSLAFDSCQGDSGTLKIESRTDTAVIPSIYLITHNDLFNVNIGLADSPGIFPVKILYTNSEGITYEHNHYLTIEPDFRKTIISGVTTVPSVIYDRQQVTLSVHAGLTAWGSTCKNFYWSFDGGFQWDTVRGTPEITSSFTGDSLHLWVCCSDTVGFFSNVYKNSFPIEQGLPVIYDVVTTDQKIYTGKPFMVRIRAEDNPGGMIDSFKIKLNNPVGDSIVFISDQSNLIITTDSCFYGNITLHAQVKDSSGHWSEPFIMQDTLEISRGFPSIVSLKFLDTVRIAQPAMLLLEAIDYDGTLNMVTIGWDESFTYTISCSESSFSEVFRYTFFTSPNEYRMVKVNITDNNGLQTGDSIMVFIHDSNLITE
ncbi:MAG: hypothetical protein GX267_07155 [Fibrobacter sp.]|jgi:hypothetical protein|nr:hypothetical protein [Fibrobacter sp.]